MGCCKSKIDYAREVDITHFEVGRVIGRGSFGRVCIAVHKKTRKQYALKYINKSVCAAKGLAKNMIEERRILEEISSPFVCNLRFAFQDDAHLIMIIDLNEGGDLAFHLKLSGVFPEERVKFYFCEIVCGLSYLHSMKILHRDIKPGNVLINANGHSCLTDFNLAIHFKDDKPLTSRSGTLRYMAPEVLAKKGYLNAIDWWSLGILTFEMFNGVTPFNHSTEREIKKSILNDTVSWSPEAKKRTGDAARDIIENLLNKDPTLRLGSKECGGSIKIQNHQWFEGWDWDKVQNWEIPVPYLPDIKKCIYYNRVLNMEDVLFEEDQLRPVPIRKKPKSSGTISVTSVVGASKHSTPTASQVDLQMLMFDEEFHYFDHRIASSNIQTLDMSKLKSKNFSNGNASDKGIGSLLSAQTTSEFAIERQNSEKSVLGQKKSIVTIEQAPELLNLDLEPVIEQKNSAGDNFSAISPSSLVKKKSFRDDEAGRKSSLDATGVSSKPKSIIKGPRKSLMEVEQQVVGREATKVTSLIALPRNEIQN